MIAFFDTSVLVAAFWEDHPFHRPSFDLFERQTKNTAGIAAHSLAEAYAALTGAPGKSRAAPDEALAFLRDVRERTHITALSAAEYFQALDDFSALGITGGAIYDALIARCALKAEARTLYTWNVKDFTRLGAPIAARVRKPQDPDT